jgi:hypothetical protein
MGSLHHKERTTGGQAVEVLMMSFLMMMKTPPPPPFATPFAKPLFLISQQLLPPALLCPARKKI